MPPPQPTEENGVPTQRITRTQAQNRRSAAPSPPSSRSSSPDSIHLLSGPLSRNPSPPAHIYGKHCSRKTASDNDCTPKYSCVNSPISDDLLPLSPTTNKTSQKNIISIPSPIKDQGSIPPNPHEPSALYLAKVHESFKKFGVSQPPGTPRHASSGPQPSSQNIEWSSSITHISDYSLTPSSEPKNKIMTTNEMDVVIDQKWTNIHKLHRHKSELPLHHTPNVHLKLMRRAGVLAEEKVTQCHGYCHFSYPGRSIKSNHASLLS
ncbi:hypothetical protein RhiJN_06759 [Ceratobasidium sp. AG-Ba]|nr:hypothetical protein RhiJN_06759 [Ceratobasidium sp. AG-Ba]QRW07673.1 hypothetical protein RhiLY_06672 [Ceratobasidium sp. AG-Ba]